MVGVELVDDAVFALSESLDSWDLEDEISSRSLGRAEVGRHNGVGVLLNQDPNSSSALSLASFCTPSSTAFSRFQQMDVHCKDTSGLHPLQLVKRLTVRIKETYKSCNSNFLYSEIAIPKCVVALTKPSEPTGNDGHDNLNSDLILCVNGVLENSNAGRRYSIKDMLGQGTFGQVVKCVCEETMETAAVKVIKNQPAYYHQALVEISIIRMLNSTYDPDDNRHIVRLLDHFVFHNHLCIVFELLSFNLFELIKQNQFRGLSLNLVRLFTKQLLISLAVLDEAKVIHCDLKPENILLKGLSGEIKLIDFGSACTQNRTVYSYIQSRFYRSPEVLLGHAYTTAIDMWSLGCVAAELFLGLPLFPGASEYDLLQRMVETLGCQPPDHVLRNSKQTARFFKKSGASSALANGGFSGSSSGIGSKSLYTMLSIDEFAAKENQRPAEGKRYFKEVLLEDLVMNYSAQRDEGEVASAHDKEERKVFIDFLRGLVELDPSKRWSPDQAAQHPFITEEPFLGPFRPQPGSFRTSEEGHVHGLNFSRNPTSGHWSTAGLSPQVQNSQFQPPYNGFLAHKYPNPGVSYGSYGSIGSYGSYGSYGSFNDPHLYSPYAPGAMPFPSPHSAVYSSNFSGIPASPDGRTLLPTLSNLSQLGASPFMTPAGANFPGSLHASQRQFLGSGSVLGSSVDMQSGMPQSFTPSSPSVAGGLASFNRQKNKGRGGAGSFYGTGGKGVGSSMNHHAVWGAPVGPSPSQLPAFPDKLPSQMQGLSYGLSAHMVASSPVRGHMQNSPISSAQRGPMMGIAGTSPHQFRLGLSFQNDRTVRFQSDSLVAASTAGALGSSVQERDAGFGQAHQGTGFFPGIHGSIQEDMAFDPSLKASGSYGQKQSGTQMRGDYPGSELGLSLGGRAGVLEPLEEERTGQEKNSSAQNTSRLQRLSSGGTIGQRHGCEGHVPEDGDCLDTDGEGNVDIDDANLDCSPADWDPYYSDAILLHDEDEHSAGGEEAGGSKADRLVQNTHVRDAAINGRHPLSSGQGMVSVGVRQGGASLQNLPSLQSGQRTEGAHGRPDHRGTYGSVTSTPMHYEGMHSHSFGSHQFAERSGGAFGESGSGVQWNHIFNPSFNREYAHPSSIPSAGYVSIHGRMAEQPLNSFGLPPSVPQHPQHENTPLTDPSRGWEDKSGDETASEGLPAAGWAVRSSQPASHVDVIF